jgi:hypothetical protein
MTNEWERYCSSINVRMIKHSMTPLAPLFKYFKPFIVFSKLFEEIVKFVRFNALRHENLFFW